MRSFYRGPKYFPDVVCEETYQTITGSKSMYASMYVYKLIHIYKVGRGFVGNSHRRCKLTVTWVYDHDDRGSFRVRDR